MLSLALAFLSGILLLQAFPALPSAQCSCLLILAALIVWLLLRKQVRYSYLGLVFVAGFCYCFWFAYPLVTWSIPLAWEGQPVMVTGYIASLPVKDEFGSRFDFYIAQMATKNITKNTAIYVRLSASHQHRIHHVGERWQWLVRLKRIHGTQSPGAYDIEAWRLQKKLRGMGYILPSKENKLLTSRGISYPIQQFRQYLQHKIDMIMPNSPTSHWLMALMIGERSGITPQEWEILRMTGTNHLMAIGGLHIGMMAGIIHFIISWCWRRVPAFCLRCPASQAGSLAALLTALFYSGVAGFSLPTQRACIMLTVFISASLCKRKITAWSALSSSLMLVLLLNPLNVLIESFWLSFGTIALIIYGMSGRIAPQGYWWKWGRVQWVIGIGLIPLSLQFFQESSLVSFLANCIAIPWLAFLILPFCFLSTLMVSFLPLLAKWMLLMADFNLSLLWSMLNGFSHVSCAVWQQAISTPYLFICAICGIILLLLPAGMPGRFLGCVWLLPLLLNRGDTLAVSQLRLGLLDVGQGLAVVVQTKNHALLFDTGPKGSANADMGKSVVIPYLRMKNIKRLDMLVISHGDNDHIGGAEAVMRSLPVAAVTTSVPDKIPKPTQVHVPISYCLAGSQWRWDNITFSFLYPSPDTLGLNNDSSCVLRIDNGKNVILLTGDIEKFAEKKLLKTEPRQLAAQILVAPHHGSKTSGEPEFIAAVHPNIVLYPTGYRNRYHFPHKSIVAAYTKIKSKQLDTANSGTIEIIIGDTIETIHPYRIWHKRYWMDRE